MPACALAGRGHIKGSGVRSKPRLNCQLSMHGGDNAMTTRGCMLVRHCKARRPTQKTADFADNVLVGHLVSNQPVTGGQTSARSRHCAGHSWGRVTPWSPRGELRRELGLPAGQVGRGMWGALRPVGVPTRGVCLGVPQRPGRPRPQLSAPSPHAYGTLRTPLHLILLWDGAGGLQ